MVNPAVLLPERFRAGCAFGATREPRGLSRRRACRGRDYSAAFRGRQAASDFTTIPRSVTPVSAWAV